VSTGRINIQIHFSHCSCEGTYAMVTLYPYFVIRIRNVDQWKEFGLWRDVYLWIICIDLILIRLFDLTDLAVVECLPYVQNCTSCNVKQLELKREIRFDMIKEQLRYYLFSRGSHNNPVSKLINLRNLQR